MRIAVVGLGHIGLPLAVQYASRGHDVLGVDIDRRIVDAVNRGESPHDDEQTLIDRVPELAAAGRLRATTWSEPAGMREAEVVVVIVPVVVDAEREIDFAPIDAATRDIAANLGPNTLVVYETTLPVGTTRTRFGPVLAAAGSSSTATCSWPSLRSACSSAASSLTCAATRRSSAGRARRARAGRSSSIGPSSSPRPR